MSRTATAPAIRINASCEILMLVLELGEEVLMCRDEGWSGRSDS